MLREKISITAIASVSPFGMAPDDVWTRYRNGAHAFESVAFNGENTWVARLDPSAKTFVESIGESDAKYRDLDASVLMAIAASRLAVTRAGWGATDVFGINLGSSRGATQLWEQHFTEFLHTGRTATLASPTTTAGNIASWVAHDLNSQGPDLSHSITCSTALHALLNGVAWISSGMTDKFLVGGSEAPLTPFTIAQMRAMKIYSRETGIPCRALDLVKNQNSMILGEGASVCTLERGVSADAMATISGIGYATEVLEHNVSISTDAQCFQRSMRMALEGTDPSTVDAIVMHAPGTRAGDLAEWRAIEKVFGDHKPLLTSNKGLIGHTFGASGMLSVELALLMLRHDDFIGVPFLEQAKTGPLRKIMVNAVGFGGNAVSLLLEK